MTKPALKALLLMGTVLLASLSSPLVMGKGVYQSGPDFIADTFGRGADTAPKAKSLWLTAPIRQRAAQIVGRPIAGLRIRYHQRASKTAWILEEIGKEMPITIGIVVQDNKIERVKILAYRESRGGQVRRSRFLRQYRGKDSDDSIRINQDIINITGATLSVRALNFGVRKTLALFELVYRQSRTTSR